MKLYLNSRNGQCKAIAEYNDKGFIILKNSMISQNISTKTAISKKVISYRNDKQYVKNNKVIKDVVFKSPSLAAQFVLGYIMNGKRAWKNENGISLKELEKK